MENVNKLISLFLGLVVVIILFAIVTGRINLRDRFPSLGIRRATPTPTSSKTLSPTPKVVTITTTVQNEDTNSRPYTLTPVPSSDKKTVSSIPATGSPTLLLPLLFSTLSAGIYLKRKS